MINTAVIGFGLSGRVFHAPFIHTNDNFRLKAIVQRHSDSALEIYPDTTIVKDYKDLLTDRGIDLVAICTPNTDHFNMAKDCLEAGKHIVIEKPFMPTSAEADEIIRLAKRKRRKVFVFQNRRLDGDFLTIQKLVGSRWLGEVNYYEAHFDRYSPERKRALWRDEELPGSGMLFDLGSHLIDQALTLFGKPELIRATLEKQRPGSKVDDFFEVSLLYSEMTAVVTAGMLVKDHSLRYRINGNFGHFTKYGLDVQEENLNKGQMPVGNDWGEEPAANWGHLHLDRDGLQMEGTVKTDQGNYMAFYDNVSEVLNSGAEMIIKPEEARDVIRIIEIAFESARTNKEIKFH